MIRKEPYAPQNLTAKNIAGQTTAVRAIKNRMSAGDSFGGSGMPLRLRNSIGAHTASIRSISALSSPIHPDVDRG